MHGSKQFEKSVFINCPFDDEYAPTFQALVFAVHDLGFIARCALEAKDADGVRLAQITRIIAECKFGVHDISRVETAEGTLPRFNMPFELGLFYACKVYGAAHQKTKQILILDSELYRYQRTISDVAGMDPASHSNDPEKAIACLRDWFSGRHGKRLLPGREAIIERYQEFQKDLPTLAKKAKITTESLRQMQSFNDYREFVIAWLRADRRRSPRA